MYYEDAKITRVISIVSGLTMMLFEKGPENNIRCLVINGWFKMESYIYTREKLLSEIERNRPDVIVMDLDLYAKVDGIETSRMMLIIWIKSVIH